jgi:hypothetical protein
MFLMPRQFSMLHEKKEKYFVYVVRDAPLHSDGSSGSRRYRRGAHRLARWVRLHACRDPNDLSGRC